MSNTILNDVKVENAVFEGCDGLTEDMKHQLKIRGAILKNSASKAENIRWYVQYVAVPILVAFISGGIFLKPLKPQNITPLPANATNQELYKQGTSK
ncbi:hypothetical protein [Nostoc sp. C117]|uniref:hypothetical protein n=1 Tax=Nostoc sp. C117 TaxID=3349875 RepID=UPI00370DB321